MSGFSPEWLALREPVDHRSRDPVLAAAVTAKLGACAPIEVVDLGCGTGSNLRATSTLLGSEQRWTLVDYDPHLLEAARERLSAWADTAEPGSGGRLVLHKDGRIIDVTFRQADLNSDLESALGPRPDLVTASALFDLCSEMFIAGFAEAVTRRGAAFYTVLTYDGIQTWEPSHPADAGMAEAFHAHQTTDKGFGASAGPGAPSALARSFARCGYDVAEGASPWRLGMDDMRLIRDLAAGFATAVEETGRVAPAGVADWRSVARTASVVGHIDTLATPAR